MSDKPLTPEKGCFDGECNRRYCRSTAARYFNSRTHAYYCRTCAWKIDIVEVFELTQPACFEYPQKPDNEDRHKTTKREQPFAKDHPDK